MNNIRTAQAIADKITRGDFNLGRVVVKRAGPYYLLNYLQSAYVGGFSKIEEACRGLVIREDGRIMGLTLPKFFNLGEPQCPPLPNEPYTVWEKIDGSFVSFWWDGSMWQCNTRGSFENEYTTAAQNWWYNRYYDQKFAPFHTVMCEVVLEEDEMIRVAYKEPGLYLIAIRNNYSGNDVRLDRFLGRIKHAKKIDKSIDQLVEEQKDRPGIEGWVIRYDSGFRVKIKTDWYLRVFRAINQLNPDSIRDLMIEGGENWLDEFPDDLQKEAAEIQDEIEGKYQSMLRYIYETYIKLAKIEGRKEYALCVQRDYPEIAHWLFKLRDDRFDELELLRRMEL